MDFTLIIINVLSLYWYFIPLFLLPIVLKSAWFKGLWGEFLVNFLLKKFLPKNQYTLIKNVTLPTEDGTTQIDHIVVSAFGVFVIETKNMKGWIFGNAKQKQWTQKIFKYSGKFQTHSIKTTNILKP
jgi:restriction system protein